MAKTTSSVEEIVAAARLIALITGEDERQHRERLLKERFGDDVVDVWMN